MVQYVDKSAIKAEIESQRKYYIEREDFDIGWNYALDTILSFLDTLEVKEDNLFTEKKTEKELAEDYINIFDKKFGNKLPQLKSKQLAEFKNFINTCEQTFHIKYFDYHATQGKLFEKLALLWAVWGKDHLDFEVKDVDLEHIAAVEWDNYVRKIDGEPDNSYMLIERSQYINLAKHFFELILKVRKRRITMATIRAYTTIEQSRNLAEFLPLESADMGYLWNGTSFCEYPVSNQTIFKRIENIPCWSLSALLNLLPTLDDRNAILCKDIKYDKWHICYHGTATLPIIDTERYNNSVDACYEMIMKLKNEGKL